MFKQLLTWMILLLAVPTVMAGSAEFCGKEAKPCLEYGAKVFAERCSLCHGSDGLGEGILPMSIKDYPNTNIMRERKTGYALKEIIQYGGSLENISEEMPPWGDELTVTQMDSVADFITLMRSDLEKALPYLQTASKNLKPSKRIGRGVFMGRCALCHGKEGLGDGKMARIIKNPPPFNLTLSAQPDDYLNQIIIKGGAEMKRSARMPPFGGDLSQAEIDSVILYLKELRVNQ